MYDDIYDGMTKVGVAKEFEDWVYQDIEGNVVSEDDATRYGQNTKHVLTHPERVLFVDKFGANTSKKQDGNIGGRKLLVARGTRLQERNAYNDCHFTVLGVTTADGAPVMCCVIVAAKTLTSFEASGIHYLSEDFLETAHWRKKQQRMSIKMDATDCFRWA
jgi:hypothetical protein